MTVGRVRRDLLRSRLLIGLSPVVFAALAGVRIWSRDRQDWWFTASLITALVVFIGVAVAAGVASRRPRRQSAGFVLTRDGFAVRPTVPPELVVILAMCVLGMQVDTLISAWRLEDHGSGSLPTDVAFASGLSFVLLVAAAATAVLARFAWHGVAVELTPVGIRSHAPLHHRLIPWQALAVESPPRLQHDAKRLQLAVHRPELVVQRGWNATSGTRQRPTLPVNSHGWLLAGAIRWYLEHPADRAAIGTPAEHDRLVAEVTAAGHIAAQREPEPPPATTPATAPAVTRPVRPRQVGIANALVYLTVTVALVTATVDLVITVVFRENLLAAERAITASMPPLPPDATLIFNTDTVAFAKAWATLALTGTLVLALVAIALTRAVSRGSDRARVSLAVLSGVTAFLGMFPCLWSATNLAAEPAAGTFLNIWSAIQILEGFTMAALAIAVLVLLQHADVAAYTRRLP